jgi:hypothetical protein
MAMDIATNKAAVTPKTVAIRMKSPTPFDRWCVASRPMFEDYPIRPTRCARSCPG